MLIHTFSPLTSSSLLSLKPRQWLLTSKGVYVQFLYEKDGMAICTEHTFLFDGKLREDVVLEGEVMYACKHISKVSLGERNE